MCLGKPKQQQPVVQQIQAPAPPPTPAPVPSEASPETAQSDRKRRVQQIRGGIASTIKTSPRGLFAGVADYLRGKNTLGG